jgi:hypothetical protein
MTRDTQHCIYTIFKGHSTLVASQNNTNQSHTVPEDGGQFIITSTMYMW